MHLAVTLLEHLSFITEQENERAPYPAHVERLIVLVEDKNRDLQDTASQTFATGGTRP